MIILGIGAVLSILRVEVGQIIVTAALFFLGLLLRPGGRSKRTLEALASALLTLVGKGPKLTT